MKTLGWVKQHCEKWSDVTYGKTGFIFEQRDASDGRRGVYIFVSKDGIEKVGKIENAKGIKVRSYQYEKSFDRIKKKKEDASDRLWFDVMTNELQGYSLEIYFYPIGTEPKILDGIEIEVAPIREFEKELSQRARADGHPMRLSGSGN